MQENVSLTNIWKHLLRLEPLQPQCNVVAVPEQIVKTYQAVVNNQVVFLVPMPLDLGDKSNTISDEVWATVGDHGLIENDEDEKKFTSNGTKIFGIITHLEVLFHILKNAILGQRLFEEFEFCFPYKKKKTFLLVSHLPF